VEIHLNTRLAGATAEYALLDGGKKIPTKTLVSTVPSAPNPLVTALPCKKENGRIVVNKYLEVPEYPGVWALGDCAWVPDPKASLPCLRRRNTPRGQMLAKTSSLRWVTRKAFAYRALRLALDIDPP
jgi:NADH dehydrogenase FAD-containing subunit